MNIDEKKYKGFAFNEMMKKNPMKPKNPDDYVDSNKINVFDLHEPNYEIYFITKSVIKHSFNFEIPKNPVKALKYIENQHSQYIIDENTFFLFKKTDDNLFGVLYTTVVGNGELKPYVFELDFNDEKKISVDSENENERNIILAIIFKSLIYINLIDTEFKFVEANKRIGNRKKGIRNGTKYDLTIVDSVWNKIVVRNKGFKVRGHLRLQPYGVGLKDRKLIWINEHKKNGYVRGLNKEMVLN